MTALGLGAVLKAKQKLVEKVDNKNVDEKAYRVAVADEQKMFSLIGQLWLTLQQFGEACLRTSVELVCDRKTRKIALKEGLTEDTSIVLKQAIEEKLQVVLGQSNKKVAPAAKSPEIEQREVQQAIDKGLERERELRMAAEASVAGLTAQLAEAEENAERLQQNLHARIRELQQSEARNEILQAKMNELATELATAQGRAKQLEEENQKLETETKILKERIENLQEQLELSKGRVAELEEENEAFKLKIESLEEEKRQLEEELALAQEKFAELEKENEALKAEIENLKEQLKEIEVLKAKIEELERRIEELQEELATAKTELENALAALAEVQEKLASMEARALAAEAAAAEAQAMVEELERRVAKAEAEICKVQAERDAMEAERDEIQAELTELLSRKTDVKTSSTQTTLTGERIGQLTDEIKRLNIMIEELQLKLRELMENLGKSKVKGVSEEVAKAMQSVGLEPAMFKTRSAFQRLYDDAMERIERMEKLRIRHMAERRLNYPHIDLVSAADFHKCLETSAEEALQKNSKPPGTKSFTEGKLQYSLTKSSVTGRQRGPEGDSFHGGLLVPIGGKGPGIAEPRRILRTPSPVPGKPRRSRDGNSIIQMTSEFFRNSPRQNADDLGASPTSHATTVGNGKEQFSNSHVNFQSQLSREARAAVAPYMDRSMGITKEGMTSCRSLPELCMQMEGAALAISEKQLKSAEKRRPRQGH